VKITNLVRFSLLLAAAACASSKAKTAAGPAPVAAPPALPAIALDPADKARPTLAFVVSAASPLRLAADLDAVSKSLQLPMPLGQSAIEQLVKTPIAGVTLTRVQLDRLDPGQSVGVAMLVGAGDPACAAFTFKDAALAQRTLEELGSETQRKGGASARRLPSGAEIWAGLSGSTLLTASTQDALIKAGGLAIEAQRAPRDGQVQFSVYPQNLARAQGVPLSTMVEMAAAAMNAKLEETAKAPKPAKGKKTEKAEKKDSPELTPAMSKLVVAFFKVAAQPIAESEAVHLGLKVGTADGFRLRTEIVPMAGSPSAARTQTRPYALDAKLGVNDDRTTVIAFSEAGSGMAAVINALATTGPAGKVVSQKMATVTNELIGGGSCHVKAVAPLDNLCAFQLRAGVTPARALDGYADAFKSTQAWNNEVMGSKKSRVTVKKSKDVVEIEVLAPNPDPRSRAMQKAMWGGDLQKYALAVRDGRLLVAQGAKPREVLQRWDQPAKAGAAPIFDGVSGRTRGAEVLLYLDLMSFVGAVSKAAEDPSVKQVGAMMNAVPGLSELRAPLVMSMWGGKTTAFDFQFPFQTLANVAQVVRPFMGMMGGPPPSNSAR
jgi:hypothetical protein